MVIFKIFLAAILICSAPHVSFSQNSKTQFKQFAAKKKKSKSRRKLSWKKYHAICGGKNDSREANFEKAKGRTILWVGTVAEISKDVALGNNRYWAENVIRVKMDPSESLVADVRLRIPKAMAKKMMSFENGQHIAFKGKIMYMGTRLSDHVVEVENFKRVKPRKKKTPKKRPS